jgi:glutamate---cysteine ligase / carboxylate-amine ligase
MKSPSAEVEDRFGSSSSLSIGVEEELLLVDGGCGLAAESEQVIEAVSGEGAAERISTEIFATQIELKTGICEDAGCALEELTDLRRVVSGHGFAMLGSGLHPDDDEKDPAFVEKPRYEKVQKDLASLLRTPPCGLHVHVGMPDPETAIRVGNVLRHHLPVLQALTANSPFRQGEDSGLASARASVVGSYPRFEMPREFRDYEHFCEVADQLIAAAGVKDYTYLWWDVRPHPKLGTVEVRGMDVQAGVETNAAAAALIQALAAKEIDRPSGRGLVREALEEYYFQAGRHGLQAELALDEDTRAPATEVAGRVLEEVRPYARDLGSDAAFVELERILREGNGADRQRRVHESDGMPGLLRDLAQRTRA